MFSKNETENERKKKKNKTRKRNLTYYSHYFSLLLLYHKEDLPLNLQILNFIFICEVRSN